MEASHSVSSGSSHQEDSWTCRRCGWVYPNPHPSAKHRRNHKKQCGKIKGFELRHELHKGGSSDEASSDDESHAKKEHLPPQSLQPFQAQHPASSPAAPFPALDHPVAFVEKEICTDSAANDQQSRDFSLIEDNAPEGVKADLLNLQGVSTSSDVKSRDPAHELTPSMDSLDEPSKDFIGGEEKVSHAASLDEIEVVQDSNPPATGSPFPALVHPVAFVEKEICTDSADNDQQSRDFSVIKDNAPEGVKADSPNLQVVSTSSDVKSGDPAHELTPSMDSLDEPSKDFLGGEEKVSHAASLDEVEMVPHDSPLDGVKADSPNLQGVSTSSDVKSGDPDHVLTASMASLDELSVEFLGGEKKASHAASMDEVEVVPRDSPQLDTEHNSNSKENVLTNQGGLKIDHHDLWTCHHCGWAYPNAHPSAKHRRNHKKHCNEVRGSSIGSMQAPSVGGGSSEEASSDEENSHHESRAQKNIGSSVTRLNTGTPMPKDVHTLALQESDGNLCQVSEGQDGLSGHTLEEASIYVSALPSSDASPQASVAALQSFPPAFVEEGQDGLSGHAPDEASSSSVSALLSSDASPPASVTLDAFPAASVEEKGVTTNKLDEPSIVVPAIDSGKTVGGDETLDAATGTGPKGIVMSKEETDAAAAGVFQQLDASFTFENGEALNDGTLDDPHRKANVETLAGGLGKGDGGLACHAVSSDSPPSHTFLSDNTSPENEARREILLLSTISPASEDTGLTKDGQTDAAAAAAAAGVFQLDASSKFENGGEALNDGTVDDPHRKENVKTLAGGLGRGDGGLALHGVSSDSPPSHTFLSDDTSAENELLLSTISSGSEDTGLTKDGETDTAAAGVFQLDASSKFENHEALNEGTLDDPHRKENVATLAVRLGRGDGGLALHGVSSDSPSSHTFLSDDTSAENESMREILLLSTISSTSEDTGLTKDGETDAAAAGVSQLYASSKFENCEDLNDGTLDDPHRKENVETLARGLGRGDANGGLAFHGVSSDNPPSHTFLSDGTSAENESMQEILLLSTISSASEDTGMTKDEETDTAAAGAFQLDASSKFENREALNDGTLDDPHRNANVNTLAGGLGRGDGGLALRDSLPSHTFLSDNTSAENKSMREILLLSTISSASEDTGLPKDGKEEKRLVSGQRSQGTLEEDSPQAATSTGAEGKFDSVDEVDTSKAAIASADVSGKSIEQSLHKTGNAIMENVPSKSEDVFQGAVSTTEVGSAEITCMKGSTPQDTGLFEVATEKDTGGIPSIKDAQQDNTAEATGSSKVIKESDAEEDIQVRNLCETRDGESLEISSIEKNGITGSDTGFVQQAEFRASAPGRSDSLETEIYEDAPDSLETCSEGGSIEENGISDELRQTSDGRQEEANSLGDTSLDKKTPDVSTEPQEKPNALDHPNAPEAVSEEKTVPLPGKTYAVTSETQDLKAPSPEAWQELGTSDVVSESNEAQTEELIQAKNGKSSSSEVKEDSKSGKSHTPLRSLLAKEGSEKTDQIIDTSNAEGPGDSKKLEGLWGPRNGTKPKARSIWSHCICCPAVH